MTRMKRILAGAALALASTLAGVAALAPAQAHHSYAMFDMGNELELKGTIVQFKWTNPHAWLVISVPDEDGNPVTWHVEMNSPGTLVDQGWKRSTLRPGQAVVISVHPLKDKKAGGSFVTLTLPNGKKLRG